MRVIEAEAKKLMSMRGISVPAPGRLYGVHDVISDPVADVVVKAQVLNGKRAEAGLIDFANPRTVSDVLGRIREAMKKRGEEPYVLIEKKADIAAEYYLAWRIDDIRQKYVLMFSLEGGTDIEERGGTIRQWVHDPCVEMHPHMLGDFLRESGVPSRTIGHVARFATSLLQMFREEDATLIEINPLVVTGSGPVMALDAKLVLDDNAASRHGEWSSFVSSDLQRRGGNRLEQKADASGFTFVELEGKVAIFSAGAGLGMCILDILGDAGMPAANFADTSGGSGSGTFGKLGEIVFELAERPEIEAILFFFVLSATSLKGAVDAFCELVDRTPPRKPLIVGLQAAGAAEREMTLEQARAALESRGLTFVSDLTEAVDALKRLRTVAPSVPKRKSKKGRN